MMDSGDAQRERALIEARAKICWGEPPVEAIKALMLHGLTYEEAAPLVDELLKERHAELRQRAIWKVLGGAVLVSVPIIVWLSLTIGEGRVSMKGFALMIVGGLYGCWLLINGLITLIAPKSDSRDIADMD